MYVHTHAVECGWTYAVCCVLCAVFATPRESWNTSGLWPVDRNLASVVLIVQYNSSQATRSAVYLCDYVSQRYRAAG